MARLTPSDADPIDALLAAYSAGALEPALHTLIETHLALAPNNRQFVAALEELAASRMEQGEPVPLADRNACLSAIFAKGDVQPLPQRKIVDPVFPAPLLSYVGQRFDDLKWRRLLPGVREYKIERAGRGEASLLWIKAGRTMPAHTHEGGEVTLVLRGSFSDASGRFARGDVAIAESDVDHRPRVDDDGDCVCFAVTDAPLRLTGPIGRIIDRLFGA